MEISTTLGPGPLLAHAGMLVRVRVDERQQRNLALGWAESARDLLEALDLAGSEIDARITEREMLLGASLPVDLLPMGTDLAHELINRCLEQPGQDLGYWKARMEACINIPLRSLVGAARKHGVLCRVDGQTLRLGCGKQVASYPLDALPSAEQIDWLQHGRVPLALLAGCQAYPAAGDLLLRMAAASGLKGCLLDEEQRPAFAAIDDADIDLGLIACSEGDLARFGAPLQPLDCVVSGSDGVGACGARMALKESGRLVLPLSEPGLRALTRDAHARGTWFGHASAHSWLSKHIDDGEAACLLEDDKLVWYCGGARMLVCSEAALASPALDALCAVAVATSLRLPFEAIQLGLLTRD